jgi:hypothetical protein
MYALRDFNLSDGLRMFGIFDIEDCRPMRRIHVADERIAILDYDLPATRHIRASDLSYVFADTKLWRIAVLLAHEFVLPFGLSSFFYQAGCDAVNSIIRLWGREAHSRTVPDSREGLVDGLSRA